MNLKPGQCDIKSISLTNHDKSITITKDYPEARMMEFIDSIDIYESIFSPYTYADIQFLDGASFRERFNISGDEDFNIEFVGYGDDTPLKYSMKVVEHIGTIPNSNLRSKSFVLRAASGEILLDSVISVAKSYKTGAKEIITDLVRNQLKSSKQLFVEETKDFPVTVIPYLSPFRAVDFMRQRAVSPKYKSSSFVFFETSEGYFFTTIEGLLERGSKATPQTFMQKEGITQTVKGEQSAITDLDSFHLFFNYTVKNPVDINNYFKNGGLQSSVAEYDVTTKQYRRRLFLNDPGSSLFYEFFPNRNPEITKTLFSTYSPYTNKPLFLPFSKYKDTDNVTQNIIYDTIAERLCYSNIFTQERTYIDVPGNTRLHAGTILKLDVPKYHALESKKQVNTMDAGLYMVTSVRHTIKNADTAKYDTHVELMRFGRGVFEK
jgi:hypothetical protein